MAHDHHQDRTSYYTEQLLTIGLCGAIGGVCVMLWWLKQYAPPPAPERPMLDIMLVPKFHLPVLLGGIALLVLVAIRAVAVWFSVGEPSHSHEHGPCCDHEHEPEESGSAVHSLSLIDAEEHSHDQECTESDEPDSHDHGHEHGSNPLRYGVLLLPVVLFFMGLPVEGREEFEAFDQGQQVSARGDKVLSLNFKELNWAASNLEEARTTYEGWTGRMKGQFVTTNDDRVFTLVRVNMNCCYADAIIVESNVAIVAPESVHGIREQEWIEVEGQIQFRKKQNGKGYVPVLMVPSMDKIQRTTPG